MSNNDLVSKVLAELRHPPASPSASLRRLLAVLDPMIREHLVPRRRRGFDRAQLLRRYRSILLALFDPKAPALARWNPDQRSLDDFIVAFVRRNRCRF